MTCWPGVTERMTFSPMARGRTLSMKSFTTGSATSASIRAVRTSASAASTSASLSAPRPRSLSNTPPRRDCRLSNIQVPNAPKRFQHAPGGAPALPGGDPAPGRDRKGQVFPEGRVLGSELKSIAAQAPWRFRPVRRRQHPSDSGNLPERSASAVFACQRLRRAVRGLHAMPRAERSAVRRQAADEVRWQAFAGLSCRTHSAVVR